MNKLSEIASELQKYYINNPPQQYTLPSIFNKQYDENFISDWLAYILNPNINGFGFAPISALCRKFNKEIEEQDISIEREFSLDGRRIDILIKIGKDLLIGIENKIKASEQNEQTRDYANCLNEIKTKEGFYDSLYIYLKPEFNESKPECNKFEVLTYTELAEIFNSIPFDLKRDCRKNFYLYEFILYMEEYLMDIDKSMNITDAIKTYIENIKVIEDARMEFEKYADTFDKKLMEDICKTAFDNELISSSHGHYIQFKKKHWDKFGFHFELVQQQKNKGDVKRFCVLDGTEKNIKIGIHLDLTKDSKNYVEKFRDFIKDEHDIKIKNVTNIIQPKSLLLSFYTENEDDYNNSVKAIVEILKSHEYSKYIAIADEFYMMYCVKNKKV